MERPIFSPENTTSHLKEILQDFRPDAIAVFSGGIVRRERNGHEYYSTTAYQDWGMGGKARVHAASHLQAENPQLPILALSSVNPDAPAHACIIKDELLRKGIDEEMVITAPEPHNTFTEVLETFKQAKERDWKNIIVISNDYHSDRITYMYDHVHELADTNHLSLPDNELHAHIASAEDILWPLSHHYRKVISKWYNSPEYRLRIEQEHQGLDDLKHGRYTISTKEGAVHWEREWEEKIAKERSG